MPNKRPSLSAKRRAQTGERPATLPEKKVNAARVRKSIDPEKSAGAYEAGRLIIFVESAGPLVVDKFKQSKAYSIISDSFAVSIDTEVKAGNEETGKAEARGELTRGTPPISFRSKERKETPRKETPTTPAKERTATFLFASAKPINGDFLKSIVDTNQQLKSTPELGYSIVTLLPNWYGSATDKPNNGTGGGGPGEPAQPADLTGSVFQGQVRNMLRLNLPDTLQLSGSAADTAQAVNVFVLDTAPWTRQTPTGKIKPWAADDISSTLGTAFLPSAPQPPVQFYSAVNYHIPLPPDTDTLGVNDVANHDPHDPNYPLEMYDHGLFIAGLIHSMAQDYQVSLNIHLIETVNRYGVTRLDSLLAALNLVWNIVADSPFVVNISLAFLSPTQMLENDISQQDWQDFQFVLDNSFGILFDIWAETTYEQGVLVASAGNDNPYPTACDPCPQRPDPCFPASVEYVIGVGALVKSPGPAFQAAGYSNQADYPSDTYDSPTDERIWTFGGDYTGPEDASQGGILGVGTTGYQWWAGTSFAAAIVSGTLAVLLAKNLPQNHHQTAKDYLFNQCQLHLYEVNEYGEPDPTLPLGRVLNVTQG